jgi:hypothetical protein
MSDHDFTIVKHEHHRNGVAGYPFHVGLITDEDGTTKVFVHFEETEAEIKAYGWQNPRTAILDVGLLAKGVIEFGENSEGEHEERVALKARVIAAIHDREEGVTP